ncbi:MAG: hydroxymethylbilane synthase [Haloferacaceae archaeon]
MSTRGTLRLATRGSDLALRQAESVAAALESRRYEVELVEVETRGDQLRDELIHRLGKVGAFVRALDEKVLDGEVDAAVHSMKDVPTEMPEDLVVAGVPERAPHHDLLLTPDEGGLDDLPRGATVGTSSLRRTAQLRRARADLDVQPLRGNVDTRVEKLLGPSLRRERDERIEADNERKGHVDDDDYEPEYDLRPEEWVEGLSDLERRALDRDVDVEYDAIVLAEAGLTRADLLGAVSHERLPDDAFVAAPGQGAIAVTAADGDVAGTLREVLDDPPTRVETTVERTVLAELGGGCIAPIGVHARLQGSYVRTDVQVLSPDGETVVGETRDLPAEQHMTAARDLAADLREEGAADVIEEAVRDADEGDRGGSEDD